MMSVHIYWAVDIYVNYPHGLLGIDLLFWKPEYLAMKRSDFFIILKLIKKKNLVMTVCL